MTCTKLPSLWLRRLGSVLSDLARRGLRPDPPVRGGHRSWPTFDVPSDAPVLTAAHVQQLIDNMDE